MKLQIKTCLMRMLFVALWTIAIPLHAQEIRTVEGVVMGSDDIPLPGVSVLVKDSSIGTITDLDGKFKIRAAEDAVLQFSFMGFKTMEINVKGTTAWNIMMEEDLAQLDEVIVIGYGSQKKSHLTGSISKVSNEGLDQIPLSRIDEALVGQISGVNIQSTNPAAGEAPTMRVRGIGSITSFPDPLIVVDGIVVDNDYLSTMDMNDVESIEVLKDAASAAIYGSRGANGVIMITNKNGSEGPTTFTYNGYVGSKSVPDNDVLKTVGEWSDFVRANNGGELTEIMQYIELMGTETDWQDVMMDGGMIQSHAISARGGNDKTKFSASASYLDDQGVLLTDNYEKINFRLNVDTKINKRLSMGIKMNVAKSKQRQFPIGVHDAIRQSPWLSLYVDENNIDYVNRLRDKGKYENTQIGDYTMERMFDDYDLEGGMPVSSGGTDVSTTSNANPLAKVMEREYYKHRTKFFYNAYLKYKLAKGLNWRSTVGGDYAISRTNRFVGTEASRNGANGTSSYDSRTLQEHLVTEHLLTFDREFGNAHELNAVVGFAYENWQNQYANITATGYEFDYINTIPATNVSGANTWANEKALVSYLGRVNYAYADRYLASVSVRTDGSSKFGENEKFGWFPAFSLGWRMSEEDFLKDNETITNMKLRFSWGISGNEGDDKIVGYYPSIGMVEPIGSVLGGNVMGGFTQTTLANPFLRWERSLEVNPGFDVSLWDGIVNLSLDYYQRNSRDLLLNQPIPAVTGFETAMVNLGEVENKGWEIEFRTNNIAKANFSWSTTFNYSHNKNTLVDMAGSDGLISIVDPKRPAEWIAKEGEPVASFYGYVVDKEIPLNHINNPFYPINAESQDIYVKDLNGDGLITPDDRTILGSPYPQHIWSVGNTLRYKDFDLSFMFQGSHGAKVRNMDPQYINNQFSSKQDYISNTSDPNYFPDGDKVVQRIFTNDIVMDASYVALRNFNFGYTLPRRTASSIGIKSLRVYFAAQNLGYWALGDYKGYNPEGINRGLDSPLTYGYQRGAAPIYRSFTGGLSLEF